MHFKEDLSKSKSYVTGPRFETKPGIQMQLDFKESVKTVMQINNENIIDIAVVTLGKSRYDIANIILDKTTDYIIDFLVNCFEALDGVPHQLVIDNAKALVTKPKTVNSKVILNSKFEQFAKDFNI